MSWAWLASEVEAARAEGEVPLYDCDRCKDTGFYKCPPMPDPGWMACPYCSTRRRGG